MSHSRWMMTSAPRPAAAMRLFCFPYAGSGASIFRDWQDHLPGEVEVVGVQLPGRENRFSEARCNRLADVIEPLREIIVDMADKPFYFFGHSVGALIAFELTRALQRDRLRQPFHLVVSGMRAPQRARREEKHHLMDDDTLLEKIKEYNGTPKELLQDPELMKFFLPQLREDFAIFETYDYASGRPVCCPMTALGGDSDPNVTTDDLAAWSTSVCGGFRYHVFVGDHFFIHPNKLAILDLLGRIAAKSVQALAKTSEQTAA